MIKIVKSHAFEVTEQQVAALFAAFTMLPITEGFVGYNATDSLGERSISVFDGAPAPVNRVVPEGSWDGCGHATVREAPMGNIESFMIVSCNGTRLVGHRNYQHCLTEFSVEATWEVASYGLSGSIVVSCVHPKKVPAYLQFLGIEVPYDEEELRLLGLIEPATV